MKFAETRHANISSASIIAKEPSGESIADNHQKLTVDHQELQYSLLNSETNKDADPLIQRN